MEEEKQVCQAVTMLNAKGQLAGAREPIKGTGYCKSTQFMLVDGKEYCASCWTEKPVKVARNSEIVEL